MVGWSVTFDNEHQFDEEVEDLQAHLTQNTTYMLCTQISFLVSWKAQTAKHEKCHVCRCFHR